jgi:KUP system potassium uptake protein
MTEEQEHPPSEPDPAPSPHGPKHPPRGKYLAALSLAALGVVYGDIGTSPLYAIRESFLEEHGVAPTVANVLGVLSLIFWSLVIVISIKYLVFILRADNRGEGGILALTSLVTPVGALRQGRRWALILLGLFGTALLYGDGMIAPSMRPDTRANALATESCRRAPPSTIAMGLARPLR